jgi:hypothetical protein
MKKILGDKPNGVIIHITRKLPIVYLKQAKMLFFFLFSFYKFKEQEGRRGPAWVGRECWYSGKEEMWGRRKRVRW